MTHLYVTVTPRMRATLSIPVFFQALTVNILIIIRMNYADTVYTVISALILLFIRPNLSDKRSFPTLFSPYFTVYGDSTINNYYKTLYIYIYILITRRSNS
jgi:hypothetical protein